MGLWVVLLGLLTVVFHVTNIGLPAFMQEHFLEFLESRGWEVRFSRLRWQWDRGVVVEDLYATRAEPRPGLHFFAGVGQCRLNLSALMHARLQVDALVLDAGRVLWLLEDPDWPKHHAQLNDVSGVLRLEPDDRWIVQDLTALGFGARVSIQGELTHASAWSPWRWSKRAKPDTGAATSVRWQRWMDTISQIHLEGVPEFQCRFTGDARDWQSIQAHVAVAAPAVQSPWFYGTNLNLSMQLFPDHRNQEAAQLEIQGSAQGIRLPWGRADSAKLYLNGEPALPMEIPDELHAAVELHQVQSHHASADLVVAMARSQPQANDPLKRNTEWTVQADNVRSDWGSAAQCQWLSQLKHPATNWWPGEWSMDLNAREIQGPHDRAGAATFHGTGFLPGPLPLPLSRESWHEQLAPYAIHLSGGLTNIQSPRLPLEWIEASLDWQGTHLQVRTEGWIAEGPAHGELVLDTSNRHLSFAGNAECDAKELAGRLPAKAKAWLDRYEWEDPPRLEVSGAVTLPAWTEPWTNWPGVIRDGISAQGIVQAGPGSFQGVSFLSARAPFQWQPASWQIGPARLDRPEGGLEVTCRSELPSQNFQARVRSQWLPESIRPLFTAPKAGRVFEEVQCLAPPWIEADLRGNWRNLEGLSASGEVKATNLVVRKEPILSVLATLSYSNRFLHIYQPHVQRTLVETGRADGIGIDLTEQKLFLTNATGWVNPTPVSRMISPQAEKALQPYQFDQPAQARVRGIVDLKRKRYDYDLEFAAQGQGFTWQRFYLPRYAVRLLWTGQSLVITNLQGEFHEGRVGGEAWFDFTAPVGADFGFGVRLTNVNFHTFTEAVSVKTNNLEGRLNGTLAITNANTADWKSWFGYGHVFLEDGLLWDLPLFGVFSPVLNAVVPGMGNSRARRASATYFLTNSIVQTRDLEVNATAMRMQFRGTGDFQQNIEGRMEAELLRDMPGVGLVLSSVLWPVTKIFEYKIAGTLKEPQTESVFIIPKIILFPLNPLKGFRDLFLPNPNPPTRPGQGKDS